MNLIADTIPSPDCHPERSASPAKRAMRAVEGPLHFMRARWKQVAVACQLSVSVLREIFDESAYERFLVEHRLTSSAAAYSSFCHERDHSRARRPRCC
jgi:hypothetical protein